MLIDGMDYASAVEVLRPMIERFDNEPAFAKEIDGGPKFNRNRNPLDEAEQTTSYTSSLRGLYHYYRAQDLIRGGDLESAKADLRIALKADPSNVDVAITMWKNRDDSSWNQESDQAIQEVLNRFRRTIPELERAVRSNGPNEEATYRKDYADALNTYAWTLVSTARISRRPSNAANSRAAWLPGTQRISTLLPAVISGSEKPLKLSKLKRKRRH